MSLFSEDELPATTSAATHIALARKYRPRSFSELVAQDHVVKALTQALSTGRLHHAYLFTGTRGVGKTTISRIFAKALNCTGADGKGGVTAQPCGVCPSCREIDIGRFVDYIEMDAASNRSVDEMTQVLEQAVYKPTSGRFKVYMIDEVHMLTSHAFNAMLKTLEEPPEYVKFVLATTDPQKVPMTVLSRCLQFNLKQVPRPHIAGLLTQILKAEHVDAEPVALALIAKSAAGSMRDALSLTDQAIAFSAGALTVDAVREMLGSVDEAYLGRLLQALAANDGENLLAVADEMAARSVAFGPALDDLAALLQRIAIAQIVKLESDATDPDASLVSELAQAMSAEDVQLYYSLALKGREELALAPDEQVGFTMTLLRMLSFIERVSGNAVAAPAPMRAASAVAQEPRQAQAAQITKPLLAPKPQAINHILPTGQSEKPIDISASKDIQNTVSIEKAATSAQSATAINFDGDWTSFSSRLPLAGLTRELAMQSELLSHDATQFKLRVPKSTLLAAGALEKLQAALCVALGRTIKVETELGTVSNSAALNAARDKSEKQQAAEQAAASDDLALQLMQKFGGQIVPGSVRPAET
jgi:DNA polymerase III subunit gamma/tau